MALVATSLGLSVEEHSAAPHMERINSLTLIFLFFFLLLLLLLLLFSSSSLWFCIAVSGLLESRGAAEDMKDTSLLPDLLVLPSSSSATVFVLAVQQHSLPSSFNRFSFDFPSSHPRLSSHHHMCLLLFSSDSLFPCFSSFFFHLLLPFDIRFTVRKNVFQSSQSLATCYPSLQPFVPCSL